MQTIRHYLFTTLLLLSFHCFAAPIQWQADSLTLNPGGITEQTINSASPCDLNKDGITDLVLLVEGESYISNTIKVYLGRNAENPPFFAHAPELEPELLPGLKCQGMAIQDIDQDGNLNMVLRDTNDITLVDYELDSTMTWRLNTGTFQDLHIAEPSFRVDNPAFYDLDKDDDLDFITNAASEFGNIKLECYLNKGTNQAPLWQKDTTIVSWANNHPLAYDHYSPVIEDVNNDTLPDMLIACITEGCYWINLYTGCMDSSGFYFKKQYNQFSEFHTNESIQSIQLSDYDKDGLKDLLLVDGKHVCRVYPATGDPDNPFDRHFYILNSLPVPSFVGIHSVKENSLFFLDGHFGFTGFALGPYLLTQSMFNGQTLWQHKNDESFSIIYEGSDYKDCITDIDQNGLYEFISSNHLENQGFFYIYENTEPDLSGEWIAKTNLLPQFQGHHRDTLFMDINFVDIDNDNDLDFITKEMVPFEISPYTYEYQTNYKLYENPGNADSLWLVRPDWRQGLPDTVFDFSTFTDLDFDGDVDLVIKEKLSDSLYAYENTGTRYSPAWSLWNDAFDNLKWYSQTIPSFLDYNNDGRDELIMRDLSGNFCIYYNQTTPVKVTETRSVPAGFTLQQNYPNPFNPETAIKFSIPEAGRVVVGIYDIQGRKVAILTDNRYSAGEHSLTWNGATTAGTLAASGVYFCRVRYGDQTQTREMLLLK